MAYDKKRKGYAITLFWRAVIVTSDALLRKIRAIPKTPMNRSYNYVTVDSANIPLFCESEERNTTFGQFHPYTTHDDEVLSGRIRTRDMYLPNFSIRALQGTMERDTVFFDHHGKGIGMLGSCIFFQGKIETFVPGQNQSRVSQNRTQNFKWDPHNEFRHRCEAETDLDFLHISYRPEFFSQFLPDDERWADMLRHAGPRAAPRYKQQQADDTVQESVWQVYL